MVEEIGGRGREGRERGAYSLVHDDGVIEAVYGSLTDRGQRIFFLQVVVPQKIQVH
jgi:hypothetical protein